jgi:branched-chain amino acid transport system ATP-binding protein
MTAQLIVRNVTAGYGDVTVLRRVSLKVDVRGITAIVGSNGAGKTTLLRTIVGLLRAREGEILFNASPVTRLEPDEIVASGIVLVPEGRRLFAGMTVEDNLLMGSFSRRSSAAEINADLIAVYELFPRLAERRRQDAVSMSGGEQQMCAIGRGIMARPKLMMIDELSLGLAPVTVDALVDALQTLSKTGIGLLVVEQDVAVAFDLSENAIVMDRGQITQEARSRDLAADPAVRAAYLGTDQDDAKLKSGEGKWAM